MLTKEVLSALCSNYGLVTITQIDLATGGIENLNYFIDINNNSTLKSHVLNVIKTPSYSGDSYFQMMELLKQLEVAVPSPRKDLKGNVFNYIDNGEKALIQPRCVEIIYLQWKSFISVSYPNQLPIYTSYSASQ